MSSKESQSATSVSYSVPSGGKELGVMGRHSKAEGRRPLYRREENLTVSLWISLYVGVKLSSFFIDITGECKDNLSRLDSKMG
ncbi:MULTISPECIES: hypothetical protein [unclassified Microcoleus]|uniref:hypothetical protein n=1 Tax=unclassified Microcoleus TaxID=2642155 RepID=UPI002FD33075